MSQDYIGLDNKIANIIRSYHQVPTKKMVNEIIMACNLTEKESKQITLQRQIKFFKKIIACQRT